MERRIAIARRDEIPERGAVKFSFEKDGLSEEGFVVRARGRFFAYRNLCPHIPSTMDLGTGQFMNPGGTSLLCRNHGAVFDPLTGKCMSGPPRGKYLRWLSIAVEGDTIFLVLRDSRQPPVSADPDSGTAPPETPGGGACGGSSDCGEAGSQ